MRRKAFVSYPQKAEPQKAFWELSAYCSSGTPAQPVHKTLWVSESDPSLFCPGIQILALLHTDCRKPWAGH